MQWKGKCACIVFLALTVAGCRSLNVQEEFEITPTGDKSEKKVIVEPIKKDQKIKVEVTSTTPVNVYIYLEPDDKEVYKDVLAKRTPAKALASKEKSEAASLEATIPANATAMVYVVGLGKSGTGKLKITN